MPKMMHLRAGRFGLGRAGMLCVGMMLATVSGIGSASAGDKFAAEFLKIGVGARALGMGGAFVAIADDASAAYWNPAGLSLLTQREGLLMHASQFGNVVAQNTGTFVLPLDGARRSSIGISVLHLSVDDIRVTKDAKIGVDENGHPILDPSRIYLDSAYDLGLFLTYGKEINPAWRWGVNIKLVRQSLVNSGSSFGIGADLGLMYQPDERLRLGARLADATTTAIFWDSGLKETVSPTLILGVAATQPLDALSGALTVAVDVGLGFESQDGDQFRSGAVSGNVQAGAEYWYKETVALRLGADAGNFTAGAGVRWEQFGVDYAFMDHDLDGTHRVSALVRF